MRKIVSNTTPLITLLTISKLDLLRHIYGEIIIPYGVYEEIEQGKDKSFYTDLKQFSWIKISDIQDREPLKYLHDLDKGEAEVIVLAKEISADLIIIDEKLGREYAEYLDLKITGTIGVLLKAKELGLVQEINPLINKMLESGIWINKNLIDKILRLAGENK